MNSRLKMALKVIASGALILFVIVGYLVAISEPTSAAPSDNEIMQKALVSAIDQCYSSNYIYDELTPSGSFTTGDMFKYSSRKDGDIIVLDSFGGTMSCKEAFVGSSAGAGLNGLFSKNPTSPSDLGYTQKADNGVSGTRCMSISYKHPDESGVVRDYTSNELCFGIKDNNGQAVIDTESFPSGAIIPSDCREFLCLSTNIHGVVVVGFYSDSGIYGSVEAGYYDTEMWVGGPGTTWDSLLSQVNASVANLNGQNKFHDVPAQLASQTSQPGAFAAYEITDYATAAGVARQYYSGGKDMLFNNEDVRFLFDKAYEQMKSDGTVNEGTCYVGKPDALAQSNYAHYDESSNMWCTVYLNNPGSTYKVVHKDMKHLTTATAEFILGQLTNRDEGSNETGETICRQAAQDRLEEFRQAIIEENKKGDQADKTKLDYYKQSQADIRQLLRTSSSLVTSTGQCTSLPTIDGTPDKPPVISGDNTSTNPGNGSQIPDLENDDDISACKKATSLGWVICPFMNLLGKAAMGLYGELSETWLTIDDKEVEATDGNALYGAWKDFRDYANIGFAILFAIVVLSQVTGIGLSNYSIKKMLPTLIMVAVLVNISFFICQLAIDVTNIFGVAIGDVLSSIGSDALGDAGGRTVGGTAAYITSGLLQAAGIGAAGAATFVLGGFASIGSILIPVIGILISAFVSCFFLLILMALRKAVLYIVIIISPLAFIFYALPNTKSLFDRWKKMFINLLFVFPVCQILVFGGQAMSRIMMSGDNNSFFFQFTAMALQIVPIFFIPAVLKSAVAALGNIGAKISAMGSRVGRGLSQAAMGTHLAKQATLGLNKWGAEKSLAFSPRGRLGKVLSLRRTGKLRAGKALAAYQDFKLEDAKTEYAAEHINDSTIQDNLNTQAYSMQQKAVSDVVSAIDRGGMRIDGNVINPNDDDSIFQGYEYARDQYLATGDDNWRIRALGLQEKLMRKGKPAQAMLTQSLMKLADNNRLSSSDTQNRIKDLASGLMLDKNNVATIKDSDPGAFYALNDIASSSNGLNKFSADLDDYRTKGYEEFSAQSLRNAGKGFWNTWDDVATSYLGGVDKNGNQISPTKSLANMSAEQRKNITKMAEIVTAAMQNPRFAGQLDSKYSDKMNKVRELAHMVQGNRGAFTKINLNDVVAQEGARYRIDRKGKGKKKGKRK